jgi:glycosyltransferase involved in cell wall biosynthesis
MRVLYLSADRGIPVDGHKGASVHLRQTCEALTQHGHHVVLATAPSGVPDRFPCPVLFPQLDADTGRDRGLALSSALGSLEFPDHMFDIVYERYSLWSTAGLTLSQRLGVPLALEVNAPLVQEAARFRSLARPGLARRIERQVFRGADLLLPVSQTLAQYVAAVRGNSEGIEVHGNAVDTSRFVPGEASTRTDDTCEIVFVGSLKPWHGCQQLIEAMPEVLHQAPHARLTLIGDGPERAALAEQITKLQLDQRVRLIGAVSHQEIPRWLRQADIAVAPYPAFDQFYFSPLKLGEYFAAGLATITTTVGDLAPQAVHGESVWLVPPGDIAQLARAIAALCNDRALRLRLGSRARGLAETELSLQTSTRRLIDRLEHAIASHRTHVRRVS